VKALVTRREAFSANLDGEKINSLGTAYDVASASPLLYEWIKGRKKETKSPYGKTKRCFNDIGVMIYRAAGNAVQLHSKHRSGHPRGLVFAFNFMTQTNDGVPVYFFLFLRDPQF